MTTRIFCLVAFVAIACGGSSAPLDPRDAGHADLPAATPPRKTDEPDAAAGTHAELDAGRDADVLSVDAATQDAGTNATACGAEPSSAACVACCDRRFEGHGGYELGAYETCQTCSSACEGFLPCARKDSPPANGACVACLQNALGAGVPEHCANTPQCAGFAECVRGCPVR
jgi:hypothetical protein